MIIKKKDAYRCESAAEILPDWDKSPVSMIHKNRYPPATPSKISKGQKPKANSKDS